MISPVYRAGQQDISIWPKVNASRFNKRGDLSMSNAPKLQRLDQWTLVARDLERTRTFHTEVLGATELKRDQQNQENSVESVR